MRRMLLATAALLGLAAAPAIAQTSGVLGPRLPSTGLPTDASPEQFLQAAQDALSARRTGAAQEALERAQTRMLDRSVAPSMANQPDSTPQIRQISEARQAISRGDIASARQLISQAMSAGSMAGTGGGSQTGSGGYGTTGGMSSGAAGSTWDSQSPSLGSSVPGRASPTNEGTAMDSAPSMRR